MEIYKKKLKFLIRFLALELYFTIENYGTMEKTTCHGKNYGAIGKLWYYRKNCGTLINYGKNYDTMEKTIVQQ